MEYISSDMNNFAQYPERHSPLPSRTPSPFQSILTLHSPSPTGFFNPTADQGMQSCIQHTSSDNIFKEEQPLWLEELLDEPEVQIPVGRRHQRSSSDPFAYLDKPLNEEECNSRNVSLGSSFPDKHKNWTRESPFSSTTSFRKDREHPECTSTKRDCFNPNHSASRTDTKWAKQKLAQRSRIRKINYIAELERNVQALQAEGTEFSAALNFLDQQNLILGMENQALKQRLDSLSQEKLIKHLEQGMLEREITRLQMIYQLQMQQQQQHQQHQKYPAHRQFKSRDLDSQFSNLSLQHKETSS